MISRRSMLRWLSAGLGAGGIPDRIEIPPQRRAEIPRAPRGVVAEVVLARRRFALGESVPFAFRIANNSGRPIAYRTASFSTFHLVEVRTEGGSAPLTEQGEMERRLFGVGGGRRRRNRVEVLLPGESFKNGDEAPGAVGPSPGLDELFHLFPGSYTVRVSYEETAWPNPYRVVTPAVGFEIL